MDEVYPFANPPLPYAPNALEPVIDAQTMQLHHDRHMQAYVDNLNHLLSDQPDLQELTLEQLLANPEWLPETLAVPILHNAGGVYNHATYFNQLSPGGPNIPVGELSEFVYDQFGDYETLKNLLKLAALSVFGSGYAWLAYADGHLVVMTTPNQGTPIEQDMCPILNIDVWEHAYYLRHYNDRAAYVDALLNLINWDVAEAYYQSCFA